MMLILERGVLRILSSLFFCLKNSRFDIIKKKVAQRGTSGRRPSSTGSWTQQTRCCWIRASKWIRRPAKRITSSRKKKKVVQDLLASTDFICM